jgi:hypothetical protein
MINNLSVEGQSMYNNTYDNFVQPSNFQAHSNPNENLFPEKVEEVSN